ncbi:MAG: hypothetical protein IJA20_01895 [Methanocorpusculum sp.]|nr:hypothetical protein [Methanocorpusculum sp.]
MGYAATHALAGVPATGVGFADRCGIAVAPAPSAACIDAEHIDTAIDGAGGTVRVGLARSGALATIDARRLAPVGTGGDALTSADGCVGAAAAGVGDGVGTSPGAGAAAALRHTFTVADGEAFRDVLGLTHGNAMIDAYRLSHCLPNGLSNSLANGLPDCLP